MTTLRVGVLVKHNKRLCLGLPYLFLCCCSLIWGDQFLLQPILIFLLSRSSISSLDPHAGIRTTGRAKTGVSAVHLAMSDGEARGAGGASRGTGSERTRRLVFRV